VGGGQAFTIGLRHLDRFAWVAEFSSGVLSDANFRIEEYMPSLIEDAPSLNQRLRLLFLSCGSEDPRYQGQLDLKDALTKYMPLLVGSGDCVRVVAKPEVIGSNVGNFRLAVTRERGTRLSTTSWFAKSLSFRF
jgi:hypothetical protein